MLRLLRSPSGHRMAFKIVMAGKEHISNAPYTPWRRRAVIGFSIHDPSHHAHFLCSHPCCGASFSWLGAGLTGAPETGHRSVKAGKGSRFARSDLLSPLRPLSPHSDRSITADLMNKIDGSDHVSVYDITRLFKILIKKGAPQSATGICEQCENRATVYLVIQRVGTR